MGDRNFRLSNDVRPEKYVFHVAPDLETKTFAADGFIELVLNKATRSLTLHGVHLAITSARIEGSAAIATVSGDEESQTLTFAFDRELPAGKAKLELEWTGIFHDDLRGLYLAGGVAVTQFEAADARRVFPCFDEPAFKATWELQVEASDKLAILSNGREGGREKTGPGKRVVLFEPTPKMSSYLVAMVIGDLEGTPANIVRRVAVRTWAVPEKAHLTEFGQDCAASVLPLLEDYFGAAYVFGKLDQIGIPDFEAGAMENSGCITFREVVLLVDPEQAPLGVKKRVAEVVTHELAHQWFGNLVTMQWWDDLWLNEAFATWMAYKIVDQWKPEWRMWDDFENGKASALYLDSLESTHPIRCEVKNADQATENFDAITYEKGGAMLRMLEGYLGADAFRAGIRDYMKKHAFGNAAADDLWNALARASGQPIVEVANGWIGRGGYPVLDVQRDGVTVTLSQRRFYADPASFARAGDESWLVPVVLKWADDAGIHETRHLLRERTGTVTLDASGPVRFLCANRGGAGFYRARYTTGEIAALAGHGAALTPVERTNLIADAWALFRAGAGPLAPVLDLIVAFAKDEDYVVLGEIVARLDGLERRCVADADRAAFRTFAASLLAPQLEKVGFAAGKGETDAVRLQRAALVRGLALVARVPATIDEASQRLGRAWAGDKQALDANLLDSATVAAARAGDAGLFDALVGRLASDPDPASKRRTLVGLASFERPELIDRAIALLITDTVPMQDATTYLGALTTNRAAADKAWNFVRENWVALRKKTAAPMLTRRVVEALGELLGKRAEVEAFIDQEAASLSAVPAAIKQTRERMRLDEDVQLRAAPQIAAWLQARG